MFELGDYVVYGSHGICKIRDISNIDIPGAPSDRMYYLLSPIATKESTIYSPVDNVKVTMRKVITAEKAKKMINDIGDIPVLNITNEKFLENQYKEILCSCDLIQLLSMIKTIRSKRERRINEGKKMTATDERYLKRAEECLYTELSIALQKNKEDIAGFVSAL